MSKEVWKLLVTYLWEIQKEDMAGIGRHQAAKENRQRETSRPQLIQMPGLRSPVTSSASRETEAQKGECTCARSHSKVMVESIFIRLSNIAIEILR